MPLYLGKNTLKEQPFDTEKKLQQLFEENIEQLLGLQLIKSEYSAIEGRKLDTLAYDDHKKTFVVIEYKKDKDKDACIQLQNYIRLIRNTKNWYKLTQAYKEKTGNSLQADNLEAGYGICVARDFTDEQIDTAKEAEGWPVFLVKVTRYRDANGEDVLHTQWTPTQQNIEKTPQDYTEEARLEVGYSTAQEVYQLLKQQIISLIPDFELHITQNYLTYRHHGQNIASMVVKKKSIDLYINPKPGSLPQDGPFKDVSKIGNPVNWAYRSKYEEIEQVQRDIPAIQDGLKVALRQKGL